MSCSRPQRRPRAPFEADLLGHQAGQVGDLERVPEHVLRVAGAELEPAQVVEQLLVQAGDVGLLRRLVADAGGCACSISSCVSLTISSIRVGWMRPSTISFSSASLATSRRMLSNPVTMTIPGVSSTITSTPVAFSKARIFRPSRPMIRPFMSSVGMSTVLTVVSAVCAAAYALDRGGEDLARLLLRGLAERLLVLEDQAADLVPQVVLDPAEQAGAGLLGRRAA